MCGVLGFSKLTPRTRIMLPFMAFAMESRGDDSWGATDGNEVIKKTGPISESFTIPKHWKQCIVHTRAATVGEISTRNAHPFVVERSGKPPIIGIHNGHVFNYKELNEKYKRTCQVDSEHIFHQLAANLPLDELYGRGTVAWFDEYKDDRLIHLARWNFGDLEVADAGEDGQVFCSTKEPLERAARFARVKLELYKAFEDCMKYVLTPEQAVETKVRLPFGRGFVQNVQTTGNFWTGWHGSGSMVYRETANSKFRQCKKCVMYGEHVVCAGCMKRYRVDFEAKLLVKNATESGMILLPAGGH